MAQSIHSIFAHSRLKRYNKARGRPTLFVCGTDEYGTATETKALEEGVTPRELCDKYNNIHAEIYDWFNIGFDVFGRTSTPEQTQITQDIFRRLYAHDEIVERTSLQPFCEHPQHQKFLADRYIEGTCPKCGYEDARGDQCDKCGSVDYVPLDLRNARCKIHPSVTPITRETKHLHIRLDHLQARIEEFVTKSSAAGAWSKNGLIITECWLKQGLRDRGITRDLKWGTPVPLDIFDNAQDAEAYKDKVFYVWFDACIGYVSITATYTSGWERWWRNPDEVQLYQFMGKDNVPFHSVIFPGTQLGTRDTWTKVHNLSTTEYLNYEDGKFSKSRGIGVFGNNAKETGVPADVWRYYLLKHRPETADSQFEWRDFVAQNNSELLAKLGNFVNRIIKMVNSKLYNSVVPNYLENSNGEEYVKVKEDVTERLKTYIEQLEAVRLKDGLTTAMDITQIANNFIQQNRLDNKLVAEQPEKAAVVVGIALNIIYLCASVFEPYLPATSQSILAQLNLPFLQIPDVWRANDIKVGHTIGKARYLFSMIDPKKEDEWRTMYGGSQGERVKKEEEAARKKAQKAADKARRAARKAAEGPKNVEATAIIGPPQSELDDVTKRWVMMLDFLTTVCTNGLYQLRESHAIRQTSIHGIMVWLPHE